MGALAHAIHSGKALYVGISNYDEEQTRRAYAILKDMGVTLLIHQPRYNLFDRRPEHGLFDALVELGVGGIVYSPLAQGLATDRYLDGIPADSRVRTANWIDEKRINDEYLGHARALNDIALGRGQTLAQMALTWTMRHAGVTSALIGASSVAQLEDSLKAAHAEPLTDEELASIEPHAIHQLVDQWL
jgi:L-glyceraldehyde 3-phosphate reductase